MCITDVVVAAQPFVRAEGLIVFHGSKRGLIDVSAWNVPTRSKAGFVKCYWPPGIDNGVVTMANHQVTGRLADVNAVIAVRGMAQNSFVFFIEGVHCRPSERNTRL